MNHTSMQTQFSGQINFPRAWLSGGRQDYWCGQLKAPKSRAADDQDTEGARSLAVRFSYN